MSVMSMLKINKDFNKDLEMAVKDVIPLKDEIKTISNVKSFSNEYTLLAPNKLKSDYSSSISHMGFNYAVRFMIGRIVERNRWKCFLNLKAYKGLMYLKNNIKHSDYEDYKKFYEEALAYIIQYVYSKSDVIENIFSKDAKEEELAGYRKFINVSSHHGYTFKIDDEKFIKYCVFFARLEMIYECKTLITNMQELTELDDDLFYDIIKLCSVFESHFINKKLVDINSDVLYEIDLGEASNMLKRDSSYIYVDNIIYDLNTRENNEYICSDFGKLISYYILNNCSNDKNINLKNKNIQKVAIYKSRYGEVEYAEVCHIKDEYMRKAKDLVKSILNE